jgi:hypothetical protein
MADDLERLKREYTRGQYAIRERIIEQRIVDYLVAHPEEARELDRRMQEWESRQMEATP